MRINMCWTVANRKYYSFVHLLLYFPVSYDINKADTVRSWISAVFVWKQRKEGLKIGTMRKQDDFPWVKKMVSHPKSAQTLKHYFYFDLSDADLKTQLMKGFCMTFIFRKSGSAAELHLCSAARENLFCSQNCHWRAIWCLRSAPKQPG